VVTNVAERPETAQAHAERAETIREAILSLPDHYRAVIELRHFFDMSYKEIAQTLELPLSDVKSHLFRARKTLAERLSIDV
jgi:RNA polymerase sigma-70 factor (ECF subfamily)